MVDLFGILFLLTSYVLLPTGLVWGWIRFAKTSASTNVAPRLSLLALALATTSACLAIGSMIYAHWIGGFPFYDPRLLRIYRYGILLSLTGFVASLGGLWKPGPLRWLAPACSFGTLLYWFGMASTE